MNRHISLRALAIIILLVAGMASAETPNRVTILYDSFGKSPSLTMDWGFAALVEYDGDESHFTIAVREIAEGHLTIEPMIGSPPSALASPIHTSNGTAEDITPVVVKDTQ